MVYFGQSLDLRRAYSHLNMTTQNNKFHHSHLNLSTTNAVLSHRFMNSHCDSACTMLYFLSSFSTVLMHFARVLVLTRWWSFNVDINKEQSHRIVSDCVSLFENCLSASLCFSFYASEIHQTVHLRFAGKTFTFARERMVKFKSGSINQTESRHFRWTLHGFNQELSFIFRITVLFYYTQIHSESLRSCSSYD